MNRFLFFTAAFTLLTLENTIAQELNPVEHFEKVIVSPHVQATLTKGDKESVTIQSNSVSRDKVHIELNGKTLRVYLEGAREVTKNEKLNENGRDVKNPIYKGTVLTVAISYQTLKELSVRGEETITIKSKLDQENFDLTIYGESKIYFDEVRLKEMHTTIYGESYLELKSGEITEQKFTAYGESKVNALAVNNSITRATLYGETELNLNVSKKIKVTAFGEAKIGYKGNPEIQKGITIGKLQVYKID
ncbi:head GIN domain-containing protein [Pedobacter hartonius]|uniref:Putative auto-transporter adhesin, head GIN domain n=1 Tax=Pedobacter hartonius TaxID=425514 RepID=A0A1H4G3X8_9SPHI|nr:head GIN domain-containing protein [Pedobacter hartonius]SEB04285.1 Putative auto-transporter adhesin, head GIN domain [Pedobacter hartonius]